MIVYCRVEENPIKEEVKNKVKNEVKNDIKKYIKNEVKGETKQEVKNGIPKITTLKPHSRTEPAKVKHDGSGKNQDEPKKEKPIQKKTKIARSTFQLLPNMSFLRKNNDFKNVCDCTIYTALAHITAKSKGSGSQKVGKEGKPDDDLSAKKNEMKPETKVMKQAAKK